MTRFLTFIRHPWVRAELRTCFWLTAVFGLFMYALAMVTP